MYVKVTYISEFCTFYYINDLSSLSSALDLLWLSKLKFQMVFFCKLPKIINWDIIKFSIWSCDLVLSEHRHLAPSDCE